MAFRKSEIFAAVIFAALLIAIFLTVFFHGKSECEINSDLFSILSGEYDCGEVDYSDYHVEVRSFPLDVREEISELKIEGCEPQIVCSDWSYCDYGSDFLEYLDNFESGKSFSERKCADLNKCLSEFYDTRSCDASFTTLERTNMGDNDLIRFKNSNGSVTVYFDLEEYNKSSKVNFFIPIEEDDINCYNGDCSTICEGCATQSFSLQDKIYFVLLGSIFLIDAIFLFYELKVIRSKNKKSRARVKRFRYFYIPLMIILIGVTVYLRMFYFVQCDSNECFYNSLNECRRSEFKHDFNGGYREYKVLGGDENSCDVEVEFFYRLNEKNADLFNGKKMVCEVKKGSGYFPESDLTSCHGILKETLQEVMIDRMKNVVYENVDDLKKIVEDY